MEDLKVTAREELLTLQVAYLQIQLVRERIARLQAEEKDVIMTYNNLYNLTLERYVPRDKINDYVFELDTGKISLKNNPDKKVE